MTGFVTRLTRRVQLEDQKLPTLPEHMTSPPVSSGVRVTRFLIFVYVCPFVLFILAIVLSVLRFTDSDYPFGIFQTFSLQLRLQFLWIVHSGLLLRSYLVLISLEPYPILNNLFWPFFPHKDFLIIRFSNLLTKSVFN